MPYVTTYKYIKQVLFAEQQTCLIVFLYILTYVTHETHYMLNLTALVVGR